MWTCPHVRFEAEHCIAAACDGGKRFLADWRMVVLRPPAKPREESERGWKRDATRELMKAAKDVWLQEGRSSSPLMAVTSKLAMDNLRIAYDRAKEAGL